MGSISSRTANSNSNSNINSSPNTDSMGNCLSDSSKNVGEMTVGSYQANGGFKSTSPTGKGTEKGIIVNSHRDIVAVSVDHNDIRVRAESEYSGSGSSPSNSFSVKTGNNVQCVKNGQVVSVVLLPHQHSLFCERKQRVCTAAGKVQEMEILRVTGLDLPLSNSVWIRTAPGASATSAYSAIPGSENKVDYIFGKEDVGCYVSFRHAWVDDSVSVGGSGKIPSRNSSPAPGDSLVIESPTVSSSRPKSIESNTGSPSVAKVIQAENAIGPVAAGPARLLDLRVVGTGAVLVSNSVSGTASTQRGVDLSADSSIKVGELHVNQFALAHTNYIGGKQGRSEFWWLKTNPDGSRKELRARAPIAEDAPDLSYLLGKDVVLDPSLLKDPNTKDPRVYLITAEDIGCTLKVKCCPKRSDGYAGEVCTSKPSPKITIAEDVGESVKPMATSTEEDLTAQSVTSSSTTDNTTLVHMSESITS